MFRSFLRSKQKKTEAIEEGSGHFVSNPARVIALLEQTANAHVLLSASLNGWEHPCNTAILKVNGKEGYILLDELTPRNAHRRLLAKKELHLQGRLHGIELGFSTTLLGSGTKDGIAIYKMRIPERVFYLQRRLDHRVPTSGAHIPFFARKEPDLEVLIKGYLCDMSKNGIGIILEDEYGLHQGDVLPDCTIRFPDDNSEAAFSLEIRYCTASQNQKTIRAGGRFKELDHDTQRKLRKFINQLERAQIRRLRGG